MILMVMIILDRQGKKMDYKFAWLNLFRQSALGAFKRCNNSLMLHGMLYIDIYSAPLATRIIPTTNYEFIQHNMQPDSSLEWIVITKNRQLW